MGIATSFSLTHKQPYHMYWAKKQEQVGTHNLNFLPSVSQERCLWWWWKSSSLPAVQEVPVNILGKIFISADIKQDDVISHKWCLVRLKHQSNLEFNLGEEMAEELTHNQKIGTGFNKNQLRSDRKNERMKTARTSELEIHLIQDSNKLPSQYPVRDGNQPRYRAW